MAFDHAYNNDISRFKREVSNRDNIWGCRHIKGALTCFWVECITITLTICCSILDFAAWNRRHHRRYQRKRSDVRVVDQNGRSRDCDRSFSAIVKDGVREFLRRHCCKCSISVGNGGYIWKLVHADFVRIICLDRYLHLILVVGEYFRVQNSYGLTVLALWPRKSIGAAVQPWIDFHEILFTGPLKDCPCRS